MNAPCTYTVAIVGLGLLASCAAPRPATESRYDTTAREEAARVAPEPQNKQNPLATLESYAREHNVSVQRRPRAKHDLSEPAQISAAKATGTNNSQTVIDVSANWRPEFLPDLGDVEVSIVAEMHKNSAIRRRQESYQFGLLAEKTVYDGQDARVHTDMTLAVKTDKYTNYGFFSKLAAAVLLPEWGAGQPIQVGDMEVEWLPKVGVGFETGNQVFPSSAANRGRNGHVVRVYGTLAANIHPFGDATDSRLWLHTEASYWAQVLEVGGFKATPDVDHLFRAVANYALTDDRNVVLSLEYGSGSNPEIGRIHEDYFQLNFGFQFGGGR